MQVSVVPIAELEPHHISRWDELMRDNGVLDNPFLRPECAQWVGTVLPNIEVAVLSEDQKTVGFFPYERTAGDVAVPLMRSLTDLHAVIIRPETDFDAGQLVKACGLRAWQYDHHVASQKQFEAWHCYVDPSYYMDLSNGFEAYGNQRKEAGSSFLRNTGRKQRKLEREIGPLRFEAHSADPAAFHSLCEWKAAQLVRLGYSDMFQLNWVNDLLEAMKTVNQPSFKPLMSVLYVGDTMVAAQLGAASPTAASSWIPTFNFEYARYSPGTILQIEMARWAAEQGIQRIDLGRGENQMKLCLASASFDVAIGSVDHRILHRTLTRSYYGLRNLVHASPLKKISKTAMRRMKALVGR